VKPTIEEFVNTTAVNVLHVHDLYMVPSVLRVARAVNVPVIADFHENLPAAIRAWQSNSPWWWRIVRSVMAANGFLYRLHERRSAWQCEKIVLVVPEAADRFVKMGIPSEKLVVVSNTEDETTFCVPDVDKTVTAEYEKRWVACYVGGGGVHRGIDTAIRGASLVAKDVPGFHLLLVGLEGEYRKEMEKLANKWAAGNHVEILGWEPFERCLQYILASKACLVPHNDFEHTQTTVPHKLFQYMMCGRPVVVSDCRPLKRIVETSKAGLVFRANDPGDFAAALVRLAKDDGLRDRCGKNGKRAALSEFSWKHDAGRLVAMYQAIGEKYGWEDLPT